MEKQKQKNPSTVLMLDTEKLTANPVYTQTSVSVTSYVIHFLSLYFHVTRPPYDNYYKLLKIVFFRRFTFCSDCSELQSNSQHEVTLQIENKVDL